MEVDIAIAKTTACRHLETSRQCRVAATPGIALCRTDDGKVHVTRDGGKTWTDATAEF
jgi:photosystem II stability/assembly factor-like uncharacterized protein